MKTTGSKNIKDYKENTRILYCHKCRQTLQWEAIISEFSDSGEYVCLEHYLNKTKDWYKVADIIVLDTLKNKHSKNIEEFIKKEREQFTREEALFQKYDKMSYEQQEADAIEKECEDYEIKKDEIIFYDEVDQKMTGEDWNSFGEYHNKPELKEEKPNTFEVYPSEILSSEDRPKYFLEIYNGERWKLCLRAELNFSVPKFGWSSEEVHPYTLGEGKIASDALVSMYSLPNLKRIVDGLNMQNTKDSSPLPPPMFETSKEKVDWQKNYPYPITTSP